MSDMEQVYQYIRDQKTALFDSILQDANKAEGVTG